MRRRAKADQTPSDGVGSGNGTKLVTDREIDYKARSKFLSTTFAAIRWCGWGKPPTPIETLYESVFPVFLEWKKADPTRAFAMAVSRGQRWSTLSQLTHPAAIALTESIREWMDRHRFHDGWIADQAFGTLYLCRENWQPLLFVDPYLPAAKAPERPAFVIEPVKWTMRREPIKGQSGASIDVAASAAEHLAVVEKRVAEELQKYRRRLEELYGDRTSDENTITWLAFRWTGATYREIANVVKNSEDNIRHNIENCADRIGLDRRTLERPRSRSRGMKP